MTAPENQTPDHEIYRHKYEQGGEAAIEYFLSVVEKDSRSKLGYFYLKLLATDDGDIRNALKYAKQLKQINSGDVNQYLNTGCIYELAGTYDKAIQYYRKEMAAHSDNPYTYFFLGQLYSKQKKWGKSIRSFRKFLMMHEMLPDFYVDEARECLARVYYETHQLDKEIKIYSDMLDDDASNISALRNLGAAYLDAGDYATSLECLRKAKAMGEFDASVDRDIAKAERGLRRAK